MIVLSFWVKESKAQQSAPDVLKQVVSRQVHSELEYKKILRDFKKVRKKYKFAFSRRCFQKKIDFSVIDTNSVYISEYEEEYILGNKLSAKYSVYKFYRFFGDGIVFLSGPYYSPVDSATFENVTYGSWMCYTMNRKGQLIIEIPKQFEMDRRWNYYYCQVSNDAIKFVYIKPSYYNFWSSPNYVSPDWIYIKKRVNFKNRNYKWNG